MTLADLAKRANDILAEYPRLASLPVYVRRTKSRRTTEYIPIRYLGSGTLSVGTTDMVEARADDVKIIVFDSAHGVK